MNKAITIPELNRINTIKNEDEYNEIVVNKAIDECILEINDLLKRYWHRIGTENYTFPIKFNYGYDSFDKAQELFLENGFSLQYYQPHGMLSIKTIKNE